MEVFDPVNETNNAAAIYTETSWQLIVSAPPRTRWRPSRKLDPRRRARFRATTNIGWTKRDLTLRYGLMSGIRFERACSQVAAGADRVASDDPAASASQNTSRSSSAWSARFAGFRTGGTPSGSNRL